MLKYLVIHKRNGFLVESRTFWNYFDASNFVLMETEDIYDLAASGKLWPILGEIHRYITDWKASVYTNLNRDEWHILPVSTGYHVTVCERNCYCR